MGIMDEIGHVLQQYTNNSSGNTGRNVEHDFAQVAPQVAPTALASGLGDAFRSDQTPPFGQMVSRMFGQSNGEQRAGILNHLLGAVGPGMLSTSVLGGLSSLLQGRASITPQQAEQVSPDAVENLAEHAQRQDPSIVDRASEFYAQHPTLVQGLGAGALAFVMSRMSQRG
jgi:hypothetical protein